MKNSSGIPHRRTFTATRKDGAITVISDGRTLHHGPTFAFLSSFRDPAKGMWTCFGTLEEMSTKMNQAVRSLRADKDPGMDRLAAEIYVVDASDWPIADLNKCLNMTLQLGEYLETRRIKGIQEIADTLRKHQSKYGAGFYCIHGRFFGADEVKGKLWVNDFYGIMKEVSPADFHFTDHNGQVILDRREKLKSEPTTIPCEEPHTASVASTRI